MRAFPSEIQSNIAAQMADSLIGVVSQRLQFRPQFEYLRAGMRSAHGHDG